MELRPFDVRQQHRTALLYLFLSLDKKKQKDFIKKRKLTKMSSLTVPTVTG